MTRDPLAQAPRVDEYERRAMLADQLCEAIVDLRPDFVGHHRFERRVRQLDGKVAVPLVSAVDDAASRIALPIETLDTDEQPRDFGDRLLRGRQADTSEPAAGERIEPLQRQCQVRAALGA